jgi:glycosyltransferase involved in cell wall biosynthesis
MEKIIILKGRYRQEDLANIFRCTFALVVPSVMTKEGYVDGIPTVIYEAMAYGRPVIASSISGIPEVIRNHETGVLVEPGDVTALADAMKYLMEHRVEALAISNAARKYVCEHHNHITSGRRLYEILRVNTAQPGDKERGIKSGNRI